MRWQPGSARGIIFLAVVVAVLAVPRAAQSQTSGSSSGSSVSTPQAGVIVNAEGVLEKRT